MPIIDGYWHPNLSIKQAHIASCRKRYHLVSGPKKSGKTIGCCHRVIRHAFETDRARVGVFTKTIKVAKDGGVWTDLVDIALPEWIAGNIGLELVTGPKVDGQTRQVYFEILNKFKTKSRIVLNSLDYDKDIEAAIRGKRYSMIYFNELSNFRDRIVFDISIDQLRCVHLGYDDHQWLADCNPADDGEESWIYKLFYIERADEGHADPTFRNDIELTEVMIEDNPFLNDRERTNLYATFRHDPDLFDRYIKGLWVTATRDSHFTDVFRPEFHIIGDATHMREEEWDVLLPSEGCADLISGSDIGSINHSFHIIEPLLVDGKITYNVIDELVLIGEKVGLGDLTDMFMEKMDYWESFLGRPVLWRHWSDKSAFDSFRPMAELYDQQFIHKYSDGRISLQAAPKFPESVRRRVDVIRRLLFAERLLVSAKCIRTISMLRSLKRGKGASFVDRSSIHKHPFDSLSYALLAEAPADLEPERVEPRSGKLILMG